MNRLFCSVALLSLVGCASVSATSRIGRFEYLGGAYVYLDKEDSNYKQYFNSITLQTKSGTVELDDAVLPLKVCPSDSDWICIIGGGIYFAIPKHPREARWSYDGYDFVDTGMDKIQLFGKDHDIHVISARRSGDANPATICVTYYSGRDGVLGFTMMWTSPYQSETYFLKDDKGFGSSD